MKPSLFTIAFFTFTLLFAVCVVRSAPLPPPNEEVDALAEELRRLIEQPPANGAARQPPPRQAEPRRELSRQGSTVRGNRRIQAPDYTEQAFIRYRGYVEE